MKKLDYSVATIKQLLTVLFTEDCGKLEKSKARKELNRRGADI